MGLKSESDGYLQEVSGLWAVKPVNICDPSRTGARSWVSSSTDAERLSADTEGSLQHRVEVHNGRVTGGRVAEQRPGLARRRAQGTARIRQRRAIVGFVLRRSRNGAENAKGSVSLAGLDQKQSQSAAKTVDAHVTHAAAEVQCLLDNRARARFVAGGERHARETTKRDGARSGRGASASERRGIREQAARIGEIPARELDARANRKRLGHGLLVVSTPADAYELVCVALRVVDGTAVKVRIADHRERPAAHCGTPLRSSRWA